MNKKLLTIILVILILFVVVFITGFLYFMLNGREKFSKGFNYELSQNEIYNETIEDEFREIRIKSGANEIEINNSNDNNFKVLVYGKNKKRLNVSVVNGILSVLFDQKKCIGFCFNDKIGKIKIYVPENYENIISVENDYGDIKIDRFKNATINVLEDAGNVEVKEANNLSIDKDFGNIKIDKINKYIGIKSDYGDIDINNLFITIKSSIKSDFGTINIRNTNEIFIDAKTDLGNVKLSNNYKSSDIILKLRNDCGDIVVNN